MLLEQKGREPADVWAVACVIKEIYSLDRVWHIIIPEDTKEEVKAYMDRGEIPELLNVPDFLHEILTDCFKYDAEKRPKMVDLLNFFSPL